jgi:hypothetical protein
MEAQRRRAKRWIGQCLQALYVGFRGELFDLTLLLNSTV